MFITSGLLSSLYQGVLFELLLKVSQKIFNPEFAEMNIGHLLWKYDIFPGKIGQEDIL